MAAIGVLEGTLSSQVKRTSTTMFMFFISEQRLIEALTQT